MNLKARLFVVTLFAAGCSSKTGTEESTATETVAEAINDAQDSDIPMGRELDGRIPVSARRWEHEGIQCDTTPESTAVEVCGQTFAADLHLSWTDCQARFPGHGGRGWHRGPGPGQAPDTGTMDTATGPVSSGSVAVVTTVEATAECAEGVAFRFQEQSSHDITHTHPNGEVVKHSGSISSDAVGVSDREPQSRATTFDTTRARVDAEGNTLDSLHLAGTLQETFDATTTPATRTSTGTLTATREDGSSSTVTLTGVTRVPPSVCTWPVSGTLERTTAEGTTQVLVYGPECGQATLDGEVITLPSRPHGGGGKGRGGPGGERPDAPAGGR